MADVLAEVEPNLNENSMFSNENNNYNRLMYFKEWAKKQRNQLRPWRKFLDVNEFSKPKDISEAGQRIAKNISIYQANYMVVCMFFALYCLITSPLLLAALATLMGAIYFISRRNPTDKLKVFGREFSVFQQYAITFVISVPLLLVASAGSAIFWVIGASVVAITLHASFWQASVEEETLELEEIKTMS